MDMLFLIMKKNEEKIFLTDDKQKLITENIGLLKSFFYKIKKNKIIPQKYLDDFYSELQYKFCMSAISYKKESSYKFSTYSRGGFNFAVKTILAKIEKLSCCEDFSTINFSEEDDSIFWDPVSQNNIQIVEINKINAFIDENNLIQKRDKDIIKSYYIEGLSLSKSANKHKLSKERVRQIVKQGISKLREKAVKENLDMEDFLVKL